MSHLLVGGVGTSIWLLGSIAELLPLRPKSRQSAMARHPRRVGKWQTCASPLSRPIYCPLMPAGRMCALLRIVATINTELLLLPFNTVFCLLWHTHTHTAEKCIVHRCVGRLISVKSHGMFAFGNIPWHPISSVYLLKMQKLSSPSSAAETGSKLGPLRLICSIIYNPPIYV